MEKNFIQPKLETERLILEPITEEHAQELCDLFSDTELHQFVPQEPQSLEQQKERCARWAKRCSPDGSELWLNWAGRDQKTKKVVAHFQAGMKKDNIASIGYLVSRDFQNQGIATEGLKIVFEYLHQTLGAKEIKAWIDTRNTASHRLAKKLGMVQVGIIKNADFFKGSSSDEFVFSKVFEKKTTTKDYKKYYENPIAVKAGDQVAWIPKDSEWAGWRWCIHPTTKKEGWVPENALQIEGSSAVVLRDYSAAELTAKAHESFLILKEESGWYWCQNNKMEHGWLPMELF